MKMLETYYRFVVFNRDSGSIDVNQTKQRLDYIALEIAQMEEVELV